VMLYLAPDVGGANTQFITVARADIDPTMIFAVVYTNVVTDDDGWVDGVYVITPDDLKEADEDLDAVEPESP